MAKLQWDLDTIGSRTYETGIDHGVLFTTNDQGEYQKGVAWNGLTNVSESPSGAESTAIYADNIKYLDLTSKEDFGFTIEAYTYPDEWSLCDGNVSPVPGVIIGQQSRKPFGICYRTMVGDGKAGDDYGYKLHIVYNCKASPSERSYQTINDSPEAITFSWTVTTTATALTYTEGGKELKKTSLITIDSTKLDSTGKANLAKLEEVLYGTESTESRLPTMDEVINIMKTGSAAA